MKKTISKIVASGLMIATVAMSSLVTASAATTPASTILDPDKKVEFSMNCDKPGYTFEVYKIASLDTNASSPYQTKYTPIVSTVADKEASEVFKNITNGIDTGSSQKLLAALDKATLKTVDTDELVKPVATFGPTSETVTSTTTPQLDQGVYYIKAVNYPAGVQWVRNSVVALPYFKNTATDVKDGTSSWKYTIDDIELATKVYDKDIETHKSITGTTSVHGLTSNHTADYADVSLGDTVNFEIKSTVTGGASRVIKDNENEDYVTEDMKLNSYLVTDDMSAGLTLNKDSFTVSLLREDGTNIADLTANDDYTVTYQQEGGGDTKLNTKFTVALNKSYLAKNDFYASDVYYTSIKYSAVLNANAVKGTAGNPNTEGEIKYSNKNNVTVSHPGNTVYVYTYGITSTKVDTSDKPLANAEFQMFLTQADAAALRNSIATGISDKTGKVVYKNAKNEEISLQSGKYYVVETKAPAGYNLYGKVIEVNVDATYYTTLTDGTYVKTCPPNGIATFSVTDTKLVAPKTGGYGNTIAYIGGGVLIVGGMLGGLAALLISRKKKHSHKA